MADSLFMLAKYYVKVWKYNILYMSFTNTPLTPSGKWGDIAETPMSEDDVLNHYKSAIKKLGRKPPRLAMITGPYQRLLDNDFYNVVIDIDDLGSIDNDEKRGLEKQFAREGYVVVSTPRGIHLHFRVPRNTEIYMISLVRKNLDGKLEKVGEGASLQKHPWTSPPTKRVLSADKKFYTYSFVLPDGRRFARHDLTLLEQLEMNTMSIESVKGDLESLLGVELIKFSPSERGRPPSVIGKFDDTTIKVKPIFVDLPEFHARIHNYPLPLPVARILFNYYKNTGIDSLAGEILARNPQLTKNNNPIPHGARFLASAEFALLVSHLVLMVSFEDIIEMLRYGVEDFPEDEGMPLDRKLRYLFLFDETGEYVYPRYSGLGPLRPSDFCSQCFWRAECENRGARPWFFLRRMIQRIAYGKTVPSQYRI